MQTAVKSLYVTYVSSKSKKLYGFEPTGANYRVVFDDVEVSLKSEEGFLTIWFDKTRLMKDGLYDELINTIYKIKNSIEDVSFTKFSDYETCILNDEIWGATFDNVL